MNEEMKQVEALTSAAVCQVFDSMLSMPVTSEPAGALAEDPAGQIAGSVGFIGEANGVIYLYAGVSFARVITARMLGIPESEVEEGDMISDAIGELSNMVVGYVKSRLCDGGRSCTLTIPSIVRGLHLSVEPAAQVMRSNIGFRHGEHTFFAELFLKQP